MKKQQSKKLVLHRDTLRLLDSQELRPVAGGEDLVTCGIMASGCASCLNTGYCSG